MKYLKTFENQTNEPKEGDFVLLRLGPFVHANNELISEDDKEEIEKCIGYINYIDPNDGSTKYSISLDNDDFEEMDLWVDREDITHFSENEDDLEMIKDTEKYNI